MAGTIPELSKLSEVLNGTNHLACVGILIVIPGNYLYLIQIITDLGYHGLCSVKQRTIAHSDGTSEETMRSSLYPKDSEAAAFIAALIPSTVTSAPLTTAVRMVVEPVGTGTRCAEPMSCAVQLRNNKADGLGSACGVGNDVHCAGTSSSQVALSVGAVQDHLIACVSVDGGHDTALDGSIVIECLSHRSQAVGRYRKQQEMI